MSEDKFDYFMDQTNERLKAIESKVDKLLTFRMLLVGGAMSLSLLATAIFNILFLWATAK